MDLLVPPVQLRPLFDNTRLSLVSLRRAAMERQQENVFLYVPSSDLGVVQDNFK